MTDNIGDLLAALKGERLDAENRAKSMRAAAEAAEMQSQILAARIQGIEETRAAADQPKLRRDIRGLVNRYVEETGSRDPVELAEMIGCRVSQVKAALSHWPPPGAS